MKEESFEKLLAWLDVDRDCAAERYERLRKKLIAFFKHRNIPAEDRADKVFDRIADMLEKGKVISTENQEQYCLNVAVYVAKEFWHSGENRIKSDEPSAIADNNAIAEQFSEERQQAWTGRKNDCAEDCLGRLKSDQRRLLILYYGGDEKERARNRRKLAKELGISDEALRLRVHRARGIVRECYKDCLKRHGIEQK